MMGVLSIALIVAAIAVRDQAYALGEANLLFVTLALLLASFFAMMEELRVK